MSRGLGGHSCGDPLATNDANLLVSLRSGASKPHPLVAFPNAAFRSAASMSALSEEYGVLTFCMSVVTFDVPMYITPYVKPWPLKRFAAYW